MSSRPGRYFQSGARRKPKPSGSTSSTPSEKMNPLSSVCALRIWKISSCLRIPVAPPTVRSLAIWVSFWMLISFRSVMFNRCCAGGGADGGGGAGLGGSGMAAVSAGGAASGVVVPLPVRPGAERLGLLGMENLEEEQVGRLSTVYTDFRRSDR